jgi:hypothetical protein
MELLALAAALALIPTGVSAADTTQIIAPNATHAASGTCLTVMGTSAVSAVTMEACESPRSPPQLWTYNEDSGTICSQGKCLFATDAGKYNEGALPGHVHLGGSILAHSQRQTAFIFNSTTGAIALRLPSDAADCNALLGLQEATQWSPAGAIATLWYMAPESGSPCRGFGWNEYFAMRS